MREIKFRAWIDELGFMMPDVTVYGGTGMIGFDYDEFQEKLPKDHSLMDDGVYYSTDDDFDLKLSILEGEDWIWLESRFTWMQYTGLKDKNGKEIYEGDVVNGAQFNGSYAYGKVCFWTGCWNVEPLPNIEGMADLYDSLYYLEIIGNIYENPELLE